MKISTPPSAAAAPEAKPEVILDEPTVDEGAILKAYQALMAEDGR